MAVGQAHAWDTKPGRHGKPIACFVNAIEHEREGRLFFAAAWVRKLAALV